MFTTKPWNVIRAAGTTYLSLMQKV